MGVKLHCAICKRPKNAQPDVTQDMLLCKNHRARSIQDLHRRSFDAAANHLLLSNSELFFL